MNYDYNTVSAPPGLSLYIVRIVDKTIKNDEDAYVDFAVRARTQGEAMIRAILRHDTEEANLDDYDINAEYKGPVSKVAEDAE